MNDLDTLRPEVRESLDKLGYFLTGTHNHNDFYTVRAELLRLQSTESRANEWQLRAEKVEAELAALKARIAEAPMAVVQSAPGAIKASFHGYGCFEYTAENLQSKLRGKRVRLVVEG